MGKIMMVTLDDEAAERIDARVASGDYDSLGDVLDAALAALAREEAAYTARVKALVEEALNDPRPPVPLAEAFAYVRERIRARNAK